jgi:hypothetical protein
MKLELTNPKAWKKLSEKRISMHEKIKLYEKIGGAYRLGRNEGEQVYNKLTELLKGIKNRGLNEMEEMDHEVGMAMGQLDDIIKNATELKAKVGVDEQNLPGWIQDHISQSQNFINQANTGYHELSKDKK